MLELTEQMISFNSADYTAWQYRWEVLEALQADLEEEHAFTRWEPSTEQARETQGVLVSTHSQSYFDSAACCKGPSKRNK